MELEVKQGKEAVEICCHEPAFFQSIELAAGINTERHRW